MAFYLRMKNNMVQLYFLQYWLYIYWYKAMSTINPFKQPKYALLDYGMHNML